MPTYASSKSKINFQIFSIANLWKNMYVSDLKNLD